jgi:hypothetical protein
MLQQQNALFVLLLALKCLSPQGTSPFSMQQLLHAISHLQADFIANDPMVPLSYPCSRRQESSPTAGTSQVRLVPPVSCLASAGVLGLVLGAPSAPTQQHPYLVKLESIVQKEPVKCTLAM